MRPQLTVRELVVRAVNAPMKRALGTSAGSIRSAPLLLLDLHTDEGVVGRAYLFCYAPIGAILMHEVLRDAAERIRGKNVAPEAFARDLARSFRLVGSQGVITMALAGIDIACWDALAQAAQLPLVRFLGGEALPIPAYNSNGLGMLSPEAAAGEALELVAEGFRAVKVRLGRETHAEDEAVVRAVRSALDDDVLLMSDYNQALSLADALERCRALDGEGLYWIEEPLVHDDYRGYAALAANVETPIQLGENFVGPNALAQALDARACDYAMLDLQRIGGITGWLEAANVAAAAAMKLSSHLFPEVSVHLLGVSPTRHWLEFVDWAASILQEPLRVAGGTAVPPERPGTGIAWDEAAVKRYAS